MSRILGDVFQILNGNVGLGTTIPRQRLDINDGHTIVSGNLGIGTTVPNYAVDVVGDVNFTGILRQSGTPYISSQWTTNGTNIYYSNGNVGIQTSIPLYTLDVHGSLRALNLFASNLTVFGDTTILNTISSNTEQMVITNAGTGPALKVTQSGDNSVAEFYDNESGLALMIANNGNIGIGSTTPYNAMDINGNMYINGTITTNNNNISVGSGTVTAATFSGTATQVSQNLTRGTYLTGTNYNGSVATTWAVDADSANSANKVVVRDASGNFSAGTITASLSGTATKVGQDLVRGAYLTGTNYNGAGTTTWAVDADTAATANKIVARDANRAIYVSSIGINTSNLTKAITVAGDVHITSTARAQKILIRGTDPVIYPPNYLTTSNQTLLSYPYGNGTYIVTESSSLAETNKAWRMFDGASNTPDVCWATTDQYNANGGTYIGSTSTVIDGNTYYGEWAQIQLPNTTLLSSYELAPRVDNSYYTYRRSPRKWYLAGSINGSLWNLIDSQTSNTWIYPDSKIVDLFVNTKPYNYYRIIVNEVGNYDTPNDNAASFIGALKLYGRTSNDGSMIVYGDMVVNGRTLLNTLSTSNVGIGTNNALYPLHVEGSSYLNGQITTNNNNIYAGSGTVTASTFSGTATQVSEDLVRGSYLTGNNYNGSVATTWAVDADTTATANKVVVRDASGMIYAANIGIGTTSALYAVDVIGDVNFTGILRQSGTPYISSQWTTNGTNIYYSSGNVGINTDQPQNALHVIGDIRASRTIYASNLQIAGSLNILDTTTSNTQQLIIINNGSGPALIAKQTGVNYVAQFYHDDTEIFTIADGGLIGINTATPRAPLDIIGDTILTGNIGFGTTQALARLYLTHFDTGMDDILRVDNTNTNTTSFMVNHNGNVGIGTSIPMYPFHVIGSSYLNGPIITNNNINAGSGTVTAATFSGTATQVSQNLTRGTYLTGNNYNGSIATTWAVDADTAATANKVVVRDASGNFSAGTIIATLNGTATQVSQDLTRGTYLIGDNYNGSVATTWAVDADSTNTASKVVARDASGNFSAGTIIATLSGTATKVSNDLSPSTYLVGTIYNGVAASSWSVDATDANTASKVVARDASGNFSAGTITATLSGMATQVSSTLTRGSYLTGNDFTGASPTTWAVDATTTSTASKIVARDASAYMFASGVGIGTATARQLLDVQGGHAIVSGNLGIGTTDPTVRLSVGTGPSDVTSTLMFNSGDTATNTDKLYWTFVKNGSRIGHNGGWNVNHYAGQSNTSAAPSNGNFHFFTGGPVYNERLTILNNGNIGIGSTQPAYRLDVAGNAYINGAITTNNNNINAGTGTITAATFLGTATKVSQDLVRGTYLTGTNYNGAETTTWAVDADSANTASKVVARDASGNFSAGTITATLSGTATQVSSTLTRGSYLTGNNFTGASPTTWAVDADTAATANKVVVRDASGYIFASGVGIGTATLNSTLHVVGDILTTGTITASNLTVLGDTTILNTISSNTEQMVITNAGTGPALKVTQSGINSVAEFYDNESGLALMIADNGNIGIGSTTPYNTLDINGNMYINGTITTNNNNINAGSGTITATTFSGTATQVSSTLTRGSYLTGNDFTGASPTTWAVDATDANTASKVVARDASGNFSAGTITATLSGTATKVSNNLSPSTYIVGTIYNGMAPSSWSVDATDANTASKVVARDASGNFSAGTITATLSGTATKVSNNLSPSTYIVGTIYNGVAPSSWSVDATDANTASKVVARDASGNFSAGIITADLSGTATQVSQDLVRGAYLTGTNYNGANTTEWAVDADSTNIANKIVARDAYGTIYVGNVGVGTTSILYTVDVVGDVNFTGNLYQNGNLFGGGGGGSQWTTSGINIYYSSGNVGIGTNNPLNYSLNVNGDSYLKKITTSNLTILQNPTAYFQITPVRKIFYIDTSQKSNFNIIVDGLFGGDASNVQCFVNNNLQGYYSPNIKDYDLSYTHSVQSNITNYTVTLTSPALYGSLVDITILPKIIAESDLSNNLFYQNIYLYFHPYGNDIAYLDGNVGIGMTNPSSTLDVNGTIQTSNLIILGNVNYTTPQITNVQVTPVRKVFYVDSASQSIFTLQTPGFYGGDTSNVQVFIGQSLLSYYSTTINDYTLNVTYNSTDTLYTITLTNAADYASIVDITIWPTIIPTSVNPGSVYQTVSVNSLWQYGTNNSIYYYASGGNVGVGTTDPQSTLDVKGTITAGNTPFAIYTAVGNLSASGTEVDVSLPTNTTVNSIFNLSGLTSNTATGDWIPFTTNNIYGGSYFNWNVGHYIHYTSNVIKLVSNDTTANKPFKLCIMSTT